MLLSIAIILLLGILSNSLFSRLHIPALIGYLFIGLLLGPHLLDWIDPNLIALSSDLRRIALIIILTRAGLSLNIKELAKVGRPALLMTFVPATVEMVAALILGPSLLDLTILQSLLVGSILAAVSPAVIVPRMVHFIQVERGTHKQIPQLILAGASLDDVFVLVVFGALLSMAVSGRFSWMSLLALPVSIISGIIAGYFIGSYLERGLGRLSLSKSFQIALIITIALILLTLEDYSNGYFSGMLAIITINILLLRKNPEAAQSLSNTFNQLWQVAEIFLFSLVGMSLNPTFIFQAGMKPVLFILLLSVIRLLFGVGLCLINSPYTKKERFFIMVSYLPKATVQAAIGAIPLSLGIDGGELMLALAGLSILITAPIGAFAIDFLGPQLLDEQGKL